MPAQCFLNNFPCVICQELSPIVFKWKIHLQCFGQFSIEQAEKEERFMLPLRHQIADKSSH